MKQLIFIVPLILAFFVSFSQTNKTNSGHKPPVKKTAVQAKAKPVNEEPAQKQPEPVLSPAEKRQKNLSNAVALLISNSDMISSEYQEKYEIIPVRTAFLEYQAVSDTSTIVLCKNRMNHTIHKLDVRFIQEYPQKIYLYTLNKTSPYSEVTNAKWQNALTYSFRLQYDSTGKLATMSRAYKDWETTPHQVEHFTIAYRGNLPDSMERTDYMTRKFGVVYFNGKWTADSICRYALAMPEAKMVFYDKTLYVKKANNDCSAKQMFDNVGYLFYRTVSDSAGHLLLQEKRLRKSHQDFVDLHVDVNTFGPDGSLKETKEYKSSIYNEKDATDSIFSKSTPSISTYTVNDKKQVVTQVIAYHDRCIDKEETITYSIDSDGFITETKLVRNVKNKCRY
jgi:hypothetical protein